MNHELGIKGKILRKLFFIVTPFLYLCILLFQQDKAFTQDLGRHLKTGEIIIHTHTIPKINLFSYVEPTHSFINHHWLSEVVFYFSGTLFGVNSLIYLKIISIFVSFALVWWLSCKRAGMYWTFVCAIPYLALFSYRFDARPEVFSFIFISVFLLFIEKYRQKSNLFYLYPLVLIEFLWVNMHIYFIVGIMLMGIFLMSEILKHKTAIDPKLFLVFGLLCFVTLFNPNGIAGALQPVMILQHYGYSIVENQNIFFLNSVLPTFSIILFELLAVIGGIILLCSQKKEYYVVLLFVASAILAASMVRNFPIFVLVTFPYISAVAARIEKTFDYQMRMIVTALLLISVCSFALVDSVSRLQSPIRGFSYYGGAQDAVNFYQKTHLNGPIFNNFDIGSYLIYRLYPQRVYVDGRPEAYSITFFDEYKKMQEDPTEFARQDTKYHFNTIIFSHTDLTPWAQAFLATTIKNPKWVPVYLDPMMVIFVKNFSQNKEIIEKYRVKI